MPPQRKLVAMVKPPKPISEMSPEEIDQFVDKLFERSKRASEEESIAGADLRGPRGGSCSDN